MKKYLATLMIAVSALSMIAPQAEAKRLGGGGSVGKQSQSIGRNPAMPAQNQAAPAAAKQAAPAAVPAAAAKPASPWKGILGGALLGLGLGALLSHLGIGGALASMISTLLMVGLLAAAGYFVYRMIMRKRSHGLQPAYAGAAGSPASGGVTAGAAMAHGATPEIGSRLGAAQPAALQSDAFPAASGGMVTAPLAVPADFDTVAFLRHAKTYFIRLQAAWDKADVNDLREFTSPELYAELKQQLLERGAAGNQTDVVALDAELAGMETIGNEYLASVKFNGLIREEAQAPAEPFAEVWNLSKPVSGSGGWVLSGIQQLA